MEYKIIEKESMLIAGKGIRTRLADGQNHRDIPAFWDESHQNGFVKELASRAAKMGILGVTAEFDPEQEEFTYFIGVEKPDGEIPEGWKTLKVPASTWAVFPSRGAMPDAIQKVWNEIHSEWFPSADYVHAGSPELEVYPNGLENDEDPGYYCEVWIPVVKKR